MLTHILWFDSVKVHKILDMNFLPYNLFGLFGGGGEICVLSYTECFILKNHFFKPGSCGFDLKRNEWIYFYFFKIKIEHRFITGKFWKYKL